MVDVSEIGWGEYRQYSGPFYRGQHPFKLLSRPTDDEKILAVVTATEGGRYDAINMYDGPPVLSSGLIQFIEGKGVRGVSEMLKDAIGDFPLLDSPVTNSFFRFLRGHRITFQRWEGGRKNYFYVADERVDTTYEQNQMFRGGSTGEKGTWDDEAKELAKSWAAAVATVWESVAAQDAQRQFTIPKLLQFCFGASRRLVGNASRAAENPFAQAFVSAYISFAVNNPTRANKHLGIATTDTPQSYSGFTKDWLIAVLKELTFGPKISIYPHRYNAIRPVLEKLYDIDLPDFAEELKRWSEESGFTRGLLSTEEVQKALIALGEDLGPKGADGVYGRKTKAALLNVELRGGVPREFCDGMIDQYTYPVLEKALLERGRADLTMPSAQTLRELHGESS